MAMHINLLKRTANRRQRSKRFTKHIVRLVAKTMLLAKIPTNPRLSISDIAESTEISPPEKERCIKEQGDVFTKFSFLNQWKQNDSYIIYIHKQRALSNQFRILVEKALVPERCVILCWQVMKMYHLFLTSES